MEIHSLESGNYMLDGGAIFGIVPKSLWSKNYPADENNLCNLSLRCLLVSDGARKILIDTGLGDKQDEKFFSYYYLNGNSSLKASLFKLGLKTSDITDVFLTHLHFDHCGGATRIDSEGTFKPVFENATIWIGKDQWDTAHSPNQREKASFLKENLSSISNSGKMKLIGRNETPFENILLKQFDGHTIGQLIPVINYNGRKLVYTSDFIPFMAHLPMAWVCGYDTQPIISMNEKERFLKEALGNNYILFFEHDFYNECCSLIKTEKGIRAKKAFSLEEWKKM
jgi:glyoxylase-like metal-dependent hydrolase (beta-lactamase superfamily II)